MIFIDSFQDWFSPMYSSESPLFISGPLEFYSSDCVVHCVMVHAQSCSFQRTIKGWLQWSLRWWPPHHCSVPPLPLVTHWTSIGILPYSDTTNKSAFLSLPLPTSTMCYLPQHNQSPTMLHTCSMSQANHITHAPVLEVMGLGHHKDLREFESAPFGTFRSTSLFVICSILQPYALPTISLYVHVFICINTRVVVCISLVWIST